jgi:hypothetical protein
LIGIDQANSITDLLRIVRALDETEIRDISDSHDRYWHHISFLLDRFGAGLQSLQEHVRFVHDRPMRPDSWQRQAGCVSLHCE